MHIGIVVHFALYLLVMVIASVMHQITQPLPRAGAASFDVKTFLAKSMPGSSHEANPHGVPVYYDWYSASKLDTLSQPRPETTHVNFWGEIYADTSNVHPSNTRVAVRGCQFWGLFGGVWTQIQSSTLGGGAWTEDYTSYVQGIDIRTESDGSQSIYPRPNENAHFWADSGFYNVNGQTFQAAFAMCQTRLVLADANGTDDRGSAKYIVSMGADWRQPDGSCPFVFGSYICDGMGHGKYIRVTNEWRTAVFSSMTNSDLNSVSMPPSAIFVQADGSYPDMPPEISTFSASPATVSSGAASLLSWSVAGAASLSIDQGVGTVSGTTKSVAPLATTTYTLTATNASGTTTRQVTLTVPGTQPVNSPNNSGSQSVTATPTPSSSQLEGDSASGGVAEDKQSSVSAELKTVGGVQLPEVSDSIGVGSIRLRQSSSTVIGGIALAAFCGVAVGVYFWIRQRR